jgi:DNA-binding transcriptional LysR family regulator
MDLQARPLRYFLAVARERSFSRAAAQLNVSQPSLSAQVRELERVLGFALFERTSRQVALTREGRLFLEDARRMVSETARLQNAAEHIRRTELRLGAAIYTVLIPERVNLTNAFLSAHADTRMRIENINQARQFQRLRRGELDASLAIGLVSRERSDDVAAGSVSEVVFPADLERLTLATRAVHILFPVALSLPDPVPLEALSGQKVAMLGNYHGSELVDAISAPLVAAGVDLIVPPEGNAISVEQFGQAHSLPAVSLGWFRYGNTERTFAPRKVRGLEVTTQLALLRRRAEEHRPAASAFWEFAKENQLRHMPTE